MPCSHTVYNFVHRVLTYCTTLSSECSHIVQRCPPSPHILYNFVLQSSHIVQLCPPSPHILYNFVLRVLTYCTTLSSECSHIVQRCPPSPHIFYNVVLQSSHIVQRCPPSPHILYKFVRRVLTYCTTLEKKCYNCIEIYTDR